MRALKNFVRAILVGVAELFYGRDVRLHRIFSGPLRGRSIYMSVRQSIRMVLGMAEPALSKKINEMVQPGGCVYDVGAHVGYTALLFAQELDGQGEVHAFELLPSTADYLQRTVGGNDFSNIIVHNVGLGREAQSLELNSDPHAMGCIYIASESGSQVETCQIVTLDEYVSAQQLEPPTLIKMDVERAELDALHGGAATIQAHKPVMMIEFHTLSLLKEGHELLGEWGYKLSTIAGGTIDTQYMDSLQVFHETVLCLPAE